MINTYNRINLLYLVLAVFGLIFIVRLFYIQVIRHSHYKEIALNTQSAKFDLPANRGLIKAMNGDTTSYLVLNENHPLIYADPAGVEDPAMAASQLSQYLDLDHSELVDLLSMEDARYVVLSRHTNPETAEKIRNLDLDGIGIQDNPKRVYPEGKLASQLLGFVNSEGEGQYGLESYMNDVLSGINGRLEAITDVYGIPLATNEDNVVEKPIDGRDLTLTIDVNIQKFVEEALAKGVKDAEARSGSAVVIDPYTGAIKAMANYPTYNPSEINKVKDYGVFTNPVVNLPYETGSGMKLFTMSAGLNESAVTPDTTYYDSGSKRVGDRTITNAGNSGGVTRSMRNVIERSVNTGVIEVLERLGGGEINASARQIFHDYLVNKFGFGARTGVEQAGEAEGWIAHPNEGEGIEVRYANMAFGQGMTVTMMQMVAGVSALVNGGDYYQPYLVHAIEDGSNTEVNQPKLLRSNVVSPKTSQQITDMMTAVVENGGGYSARRDGYMIGGKTGTSQVLEESGEYSDTREIGSFIGYGGGDKPEYVIMTRVDEPQIYGYAGSVAAAPIFADISNYLIDYYQIAPAN